MFWTQVLWLVTVLQEHGKWRRSAGKEGRRADLRGADLRGAYLRGAYLRGAYLRGAYLRGAYLRGADLRGAYLRGAYLRGAYLTDAYLRGAVLRGAVLTDAYLRGADLRGADLRGVEGVPKVDALHTRMLAAIEAGGELDMGDWHGPDGDVCGTNHCRAGWAVHLAGEPGRQLEDKVGTSVAGAIITFASCPWITNAPDFHCSDDAAMEDIKRRSEEERERGLVPA